ncbi:MAG: transcription-repair coupling factor [Pseudomonadota bacterium]
MTLDIAPALQPGVNARFTDVPDGMTPLVVADLVRTLNGDAETVSPLILVCRDAGRLATVRQGLRFFGKGLKTITFPAWDCLPYDRVSPNTEVAAQRVAALYRLASGARPHVILTTVNAVIQKVLPPQGVKSRALSLKPGRVMPMDRVIRWLDDNGFQRDSIVREQGQYAVRGGILDLYAPGTKRPVRLDYFGDTLETIRPFDPENQRSEGSLKSLPLVPNSEVSLTEDDVRTFRQSYVKRFGVASSDDALYTSISEGRRYHGMEHWLPLFSDALVSFFDYLPEAPIVFDTLCNEARQEREKQIEDYFEARETAVDGGQYGATTYKALPPSSLYLSGDLWSDALSGRNRIELSSLHPPETDSIWQVSFEGKPSRSFAQERAATDKNVFDAVADYAQAAFSSGRRVLFACWSMGSRDRMASMLTDHGLMQITPTDEWSSAMAGKPRITSAVLPIEYGFETRDVLVISEQDILGDRLVRSTRRRKDKDVLTDVASLSIGDVVVHADHGIGRFAGLKIIEVSSAPHDCLELTYAGGDTLYLPVENIELLSRYGSEDTEVALDRLGGPAWQARKARMKKRIRDMAEELIKVAAARTMKTAPAMSPPEGLFDEFSARFPYVETDDQLRAIEAVVDDLSAGQPMDRLVCGDVGFGKTEIALRAAFLSVMAGYQVAIIVPTTLLARQHYRTFADRFQGLPVKVAQASRMVSTKDLAETKTGMTEGTVDIVVGTHALLGKSIKFKNLGLLIVDEEQRFGVKHKERLKRLKDNVHVLTLTATPIPRTLQLAMTGVRDLSVIATPPIDRLSVRTFTSPFDPVVIRETVLREHYRGGQTFYVCPRISDIEEARQFLAETIPEVKVAVAHGQMAATDLETIMNAFYDGEFDVLLSTTIVESGLDIPTANTLIVHRADMFGLAQLYQLRGRVGRSKLRAYALFTIPANKPMTATAEKRLRVLQSLNTLGAGFTLASHDLDIRGAGNLLGEEQSGHIREVGFELYQQMLEEAVAQLKDGDDEELDDQWSPQITLGIAVMIPEGYVEDLQLRLSLYRSLAQLETKEEIEAFGADLTDRFGAPPPEVEQLLTTMRIKLLCRAAGVEKVDAGPGGAVVAFRGNEFANPHGLVEYVSKQGSLVKVRADHRLVFKRDWPKPENRLSGAISILRELVSLVETTKKAA